MILYTVGIITLAYKNFGKLHFNLTKIILGKTPLCFLTLSCLSFVLRCHFLFKNNVFDISQEFCVLREKI